MEAYQELEAILEAQWAELQAELEAEEAADLQAAEILSQPG